MPDYHPSAELQPLSLVLQAHPETGAFMGAALTFDVVLPSGERHRKQRFWDARATDIRLMEQLLSQVRQEMARLEEVTA